MLQVGLSVGRAKIKARLTIGVIQGLGGIGFAVAGSARWILGRLDGQSVLPGSRSALVWIPGVMYLLFTGKTLAVYCSRSGVSAWWDDQRSRPFRLVGQDTEMPDLLILLATLGGLSLSGLRTGAGPDSRRLLHDRAGDLQTGICRLPGRMMED